MDQSCEHLLHELLHSRSFASEESPARTCLLWRIVFTSLPRRFHPHHVPLVNISRRTSEAWNHLLRLCKCTSVIIKGRSGRRLITHVVSYTSVNAQWLEHVSTDTSLVHCHCQVCCFTAAVHATRELDKTCFDRLLLLLCLTSISLDPLT